MPSDRTLAPTPRRIRRALKDGNLPDLRASSGVISLVAATLGLLTLGPLPRLMRLALATPNQGTLQVLAEGAVTTLGITLGAGSAAAVLFGLMHTRGRLSRLPSNPGGRLARLARAGLQGGAGVAVLAAWALDLEQCLPALGRTTGDAAASLAVGAECACTLGRSALWVVAPWAVLEASISYVVWRRSLRMTRDELQREQREAGPGPGLRRDTAS